MDMTEERMFWIGFLGYPFIVAATVVLNWYRIEIRKVKPYYGPANWSRGIFGFACLVLMTVREGFDPAYLSTWIDALPAIGYIWSLFYFFFDPSLSLARGKEVDYQGQDSGLLDKLPKPAYYSLKVATLAVLIFSIIKLFPR